MYVIPFLTGGFGNQLCEVATAINFGRLYNRTPAYDTMFIHNNCRAHQTYSYFGKFIHDIPSIQIEPPMLSIHERAEGIYYRLDSLPSFAENSNVILFGYFQGKNTFPKPHILRPYFHLLENEELMLRKKYRHILDNPNVVAIHIRRGDYLTFLKSVDIENMKKYYTMAIEQAKEDIEDPFFVCFTDDPEWVRQNLPYYIIHEQYDYYDFWLMSQCQNKIIANSTFSWCAAYLNSDLQTGKVYAPFPWFQSYGSSRSMYLDNWTVIGKTYVYIPQELPFVERVISSLKYLDKVGNHNSYLEGIDHLKERTKDLSAIERIRFTEDTSRYFIKSIERMPYRERGRFHHIFNQHFKQPELTDTSDMIGWYIKGKSLISDPCDPMPIYDRYKDNKFICFGTPPPGHEVHPEQDEWKMLWLLSKCKFVIGTSSVFMNLVIIIRDDDSYVLV